MAARGGRRVGAGRKRPRIDLRKVEELARLFCSDQEIASTLRTSRSTIQRIKQTSEYMTALERGRAHARIELRRIQWKIARAGHVAMAIYLGKVYLAQSEDGSGAVEPLTEVRITVKRPLAPSTEAATEEPGFENDAEK